MNNFQKQNIEEIIRVPIEYIKHRNDYIINHIKKYENTLTKWGFIKEFKKINKIESQKMDMLTFSSDIIYKINFMVLLRNVEVNDIITVHIVCNKNVIFGKEGNLIFAIVNTKKQLEIGQMIDIKVSKIYRNIETGKIQVIGDKIN